MMSQSIVSYRLLQCIVSAAQFARGELTFYSNTVELVAEDNEGQTTAPLSLEYDGILHFRVLRGEHFVRITVPRHLVQPWAESNGFLSQLDLPSDIHCDSQDTKQPTSGHNDSSDTCDLLGQLDEGDFAHFIATVAPMVAATRRGRSRSRLSMTDPLPVGCYVPEPAETMSHNDDKKEEEEGEEGEGEEDDTLCHTSENELPQSDEVEEKPAESATHQSAAILAASTVEMDAALPSRVPTVNEDNGSSSEQAAAANERVSEDHNERDAAEISKSAAEVQLQAAVAELEFGSNTTDAIPHLLRPTRHIPISNKYITTTTTAVIPAVGSISISPSLTSTHNTTTEKQQTTETKQQQQQHPSATVRRRKRIHEADSSEECMSAAAETTTKKKSRRNGNAADPFIATGNDAVKEIHIDAASPTSASTHVQDVLQDITDVNQITEEKEGKQDTTVAKGSTEKRPTKKLVRGLVSSIQPDMLTAFMPPPRRPRAKRAPQKAAAALRALFQFTSRDSSHSAAATTDDKESTTAAGEVKRIKRPYGKRTKGTRKEQPHEGQQRRQWSRRKKLTERSGIAEAQVVGMVAAEEGNTKDVMKGAAVVNEEICKANDAAADDVPTEVEVIPVRDAKEQVKSDEANKRESTTQQQRPFPLLLLDPDLSERQQAQRNARNSNTPLPQQQEENTPDMICAQHEIQPSHDHNEGGEVNVVRSDSVDSGAAHGTPRETCAAAECAPVNKDTHCVKKPQAAVIRADSQAACRLTEFITDNKTNGLQRLSVKQVDRSNNPSPCKNNNKNNAFVQCEGSRSSRVRRLMREFNILSHGIALVQECQEQVRSMLLDLIADGDI